MIKVLITGGAGFIGSNLSRYFCSLGFYVTVLDNLSTGKKENIQELIGMDNFSFIKGDIRELSVCQAACSNQDFVFHEAALGSVPRSIEDPLATHETNINGFLNMLLAARDNKIRRFIYASSSSVYGDNNALPKIEEETGNLLSPYAVTKKVNEWYAMVFGKVYGLETIGLRYFNVFGAYQNPTSIYAAVIPKFVYSLLEGNPPVIHGDGSQSRDFTHVSNVIKANYLSMFSGIESINQVYNVACGDSWKLIDVYWMVQNELMQSGALGKSVNPVFGPQRKGDIIHSQASIAKSELLLGYKPVTSFGEGIVQTLDWYVDQFFINKSLVINE